MKLSDIQKVLKLSKQAEELNRHKDAVGKTGQFGLAFQGADSKPFYIELSGADNAYGAYLREVAIAHLDNDLANIWGELSNLGVVVDITAPLPIDEREFAFNRAA